MYFLAFRIFTFQILANIFNFCCHQSTVAVFIQIISFHKHLFDFNVCVFSIIKAVQYTMYKSIVDRQIVSIFHNS